MTNVDRIDARVFKTAGFSKAAKKARILDDELCDAIEDVARGTSDDLGGGVFKKRLNKNMHRSIILAKGARFWVFEYLFAKKDRDNIDDEELRAFRQLAKVYNQTTADQMSALLANGNLTEICHGGEGKIQE